MAKAYNKNLVFTAACIGMCFFGVAMIIIGSVLPTLAAKLSLSELQQAALVTFLPIGMLVGSLIFGPICDRYGHKALLVPSCILVLLGIEGLAIFESVAALQAAIFAIGFGGGVLNGETNALASDISDENEKSSRMSFLGVFYGVGAIFIPIALSALEKTYSYEVILQAVGVIMLIGIIFCIAIPFPPAKQSQGFPIKEALGLLKNKYVLMLSFVLFFQSGIESITNNWSTSFFLGTTELTKEMTLLLLTCMVAGLTVARVIQVWLFRKVDPNKILPYLLLLTAVGCVALLFSPEFWRAAVGMVLIGVGLSATFPVIFGVLGSKFPELSGTVFSVALVVALIGQTVLNNVVGLTSAAFLPYIIVCGLAIMLFLFKISVKNKTT